FNVLFNGSTPVIIDLPQAVSASGNNSAKMMLERDVNNMTEYFAQFEPELLKTNYAQEIWDLFERGYLTPDSKLTGLFEQDRTHADTDTLLKIIEHAREEELDRQERERMARDGEF